MIINTPLVLNKDSAWCLFTGIVTDSGRFRYSQTNGKTLEVASKLIDCGIDTEYIYSNLYTEKLENVKLRAKLITKFKTTKEGVAYLVNTKMMLKIINYQYLTYLEVW